MADHHKTRDYCPHCMDENHKVYQENYPDAKFCMYCGRFILKPEYNKVEDIEYIDRSDTPMDDVEERHSSYAQLSFTRTSGGHDNLYGSSIRHQHKICLRIKRSVKHTSPYHESYYDYSQPLIEVDMSQAQFAEAISTMNCGGGVPVTLRTLRGEVMPLCPETNQAQRVRADLSGRLSEFADKISKGTKKIRDILDKKGAINKGERESILNIHEYIISDLRSNLPFLHECMTESYEKTIANAKSEIEAFYTHALVNMGIENLDKKRITVNQSGRLEYTPVDTDKSEDFVDVDFKEND